MKKAIYYDTETTGTSPESDRIIELAAYDPVEKRTFCRLISPGFSIPPEATAVHGITNQMVADAPTFKEVGLAFSEFCSESAVLIAHNNDGFDRLFLESEFTRAGIFLPKWDYLDSLKWARKYRPDLPRHGLQHLREVYGVASNNAHRALDDVMVLYEVFSQMIDDLPLETLLNLLSESNSKDRMPFGKHQGKLLSEIPRDYILWLNKSGAFEKPQNKELKQSLEKLGLLQGTA